MQGPNIISFILLTCCLVTLATGRSLYGEKEAKATKVKKPCGGFGKVCRRGFKCGSIEAERCTKKSGYKSVCSDKEVCLKEGAGCGSSMCAYNERCVKNPNCRLSRSDLDFNKGDPCEAREIDTCVKSECDKISCEDQFEKVCVKVPQKICEPVGKCEKKTKQECNDIPDKKCKKDCDGVPQKECKPVTKDKCELKGIQECKPQPTPKDTPPKPKNCKRVEKCNEYTKTICTKEEDREQCLQVPVKECDESVKEDPECIDTAKEGSEQEMAEEECTEVVKEVCKKVTQEECKDIVCFKTKQVEECTEMTKQECRDVEFEECTGELETKCTTKKQEEYKDVPKMSCFREKMKCRKDCIEKSSTKCRDRKGVRCGDVTCEVGIGCGLKCEITPTSTETCETILIDACIPE